MKRTYQIKVNSRAYDTVAREEAQTRIDAERKARYLSRLTCCDTSIYCDGELIGIVHHMYVDSRGRSHSQHLERV